MRLLARILAASCLLVVCACGSTAGDDAGSPTTTSSSSEGDESSGSISGEVVSVTLHRTGGLKPMTVNRVFVAGGRAPIGFDDSDVSDVIAAADAFVDAGAHINPLPSNTCCDRFAYAISVQYADGTTKSFQTVDGVPQPRLFDELLQALS